MIARLTKFNGEINWDESKPDGHPKKQLDINQISKLGWKSKISLELTFCIVITERKVLLKN